METGWQPVIDILMALVWGWNAVVFLSVFRNLTTLSRSQTKYHVARRLVNDNGVLRPYYIFLSPRPPFHHEYWGNAVKKHIPLLVYSTGLPKSVIQNMHRRFD